ncbi:MAG: DUF4390 domain-containing protein [Betaproteobacteria bacterium]|nr:DUF4390 domain-containing protein [Betaproteobacteria bacterium]MDH5349449.1 DUF4390 domain-containing protein [Betaproteobacteria bacterium]
MLVMVLACASAARADEIDIVDVRLASTEEGLILSADFAFEFSRPLQEAVANGVPLHFLVEFELTRPRWYWFDEVTASRRTQWRLSYHALSRQYRLSTGALHQNFAHLEDALDVMRRLRNWQVLERSVRMTGSTYDAAVRMRLDTAQLPRPLQVSALTNRELRLESAWKTIIFQPSQTALPAPASAPPPASPALSAGARDGQEGAPR